MYVCILYLYNFRSKICCKPNAEQRDYLQNNHCCTALVNGREKPAGVETTPGVWRDGGIMGPIIFSPFIQGMLALLKMAELARMCTLAFSMEYPSSSQATCVYANTVLLERRDCFSVQ